MWYLSSNQKVTHDYSNLHFCSWRLFYFISPFKFSLNLKRISICLYFILSLSLSKLILWVKIQTCLIDRLWKPLNPKSNDDCPNLGQYFKCSGLLKCHSFSFLLDSIQHHGKHITHDMAHCLSPWVKQTRANKP